MSEALEKRGHYNSCNLHHYTHYIHLCLPELVKHWPAQSYIFRSLPQLRETQQKMNWHKCLWKRNIRLVGSDTVWALYGNSPVLKSVLSLTEVEQLIDHSHPRGEVQEKKSPIYSPYQLLLWQRRGSNRIDYCCIFAAAGSVGDLLPNSCKWMQFCPCGLVVLQDLYFISYSV